MIPTSVKIAATIDGKYEVWVLAGNIWQQPHVFLEIDDALGFVKDQFCPEDSE